MMVSIMAQVQDIEVLAVPVRRRPANWGSLALWALAGLYILVRAWNLTTFCLDSDEVFSLTSARLSLDRLIPALVYDLVHPPLSYLLLKAWIAIGGTSLLWVRLLPFTLSVAALAPLFLIFRKLALSPPARVLSLALIAVNDYQVFHARYVRSYSLLFLLSLMSLYLFLEWLEEGGGRKLAALILANILLVYAHYYGWTIVLVEAAAVALWARHRLKQFLLAATTVVAAFVPWLLAALESVAARGGLRQNLSWIQRPGLRDLLWFYAGLSGPLAPIPLASAMSLACLTFVAAGLPRVFRGVATPRDALRLRVLVLAATLPPALSFAASNLLPESVWGSRHLIVSAVPYMILLAVSVCGLRPAALRHVAAVLVAAWLTWGAYQATAAPEPRLNLEAVAHELARRTANERVVTVYSLDGYLPAWIEYYLQPYGRVKWRVIAIREPAAAAGEHFWLAYNEKFWRDSRRPEDLLRQRGYVTGPGIWASDPWNRIAIVPVWRR
jgi:hypothetical protein